MVLDYGVSNADIETQRVFDAIGKDQPKPAIIMDAQQMLNSLIPSQLQYADRTPPANTAQTAQAQWGKAANG